MRAEGQARKQNQLHYTALLDKEATESVLCILAESDLFRVLSSAVTQAKTVREVSIEQGLPLSSAYRLVNHLVKCGLLVVESRAFLDSGQKHATYRSAITHFGMTMVDGKVSIEIRINPAASERLSRRLAQSLWNGESRSIGP